MENEHQGLNLPPGRQNLQLSQKQDAVKGLHWHPDPIAPEDPKDPWNWPKTLGNKQNPPSANVFPVNISISDELDSDTGPLHVDDR